MNICNNIFTRFLKKPTFSGLLLLPLFLVLFSAVFLHNLSAQNHTISQDSKTQPFGPTWIYEAHSSTLINFKKRSSWIEKVVQGLRSHSSDSIETIVLQTIDLEVYQKTYTRVQQPNNFSGHKNKDTT